MHQDFFPPDFAVHDAINFSGNPDSGPHIVHDLFTHIAIINHLNYTGQESGKQFAVHVSNTHVTLKQGQGHQT